MRWLVSTTLVAAIAGGATPAPPDEPLELERRVLVASELYAAVSRHFGHWRGNPELDLDKAYRDYLHRALAGESRRSFDLASMEFIAQLHNGHSGFDDEWLRKRFGQRLGFYAYPIDGQWTISSSALPELKAGNVIRSIDGREFEQFYRENSRYVPASDERWARRSFFEHSYLFPASFTLTLADGRTVRVTRRGDFQWPGSEQTRVEAKTEAGITYLRIPSFARPELERAAVEALAAAHGGRAVIVDVRGNHGGATPGDLLRALMDRRWRWWEEATPFAMGTLETQEEPGAHMEVRSYGSTVAPGPAPYSGPLYVLIDGGCFSACEDFLLPLKDNHRAVLVGERTAGSSGQPYVRDLGDGMGIGLSTKRMYAPDGGAFEGVGVAPDVEVHLTVDELRQGSDPVLAKARALIDARPRQ